MRLRFFTVVTLFAFVGGFGAFDLLLQFVLQHFFDELSSGDEEKVIEVVNSASQGGVVGDAVALLEQGIKFFVE